MRKDVRRILPVGACLLTLTLMSCDGGPPPPMVLSTDNLTPQDVGPDDVIPITGDSAGEDIDEAGMMDTRERPPVQQNSTPNAPTPPPTAAPPSPPNVGAPPPPVREHERVSREVQIGIVSDVIDLNYSSGTPSYGGHENEYGASLHVMIANMHRLEKEMWWSCDPRSPFFDPDECDCLSWEPELEIGGSYHYQTYMTERTDTWTSDATLIWNRSHFRFGPGAGFQSSTMGGFTRQTWNYGAFAEYFATPDITLFAKAGGFSGDYSNNGYYFGGSVKYYATRNFALSTEIDRTHWTGFGGFDQTNYSATAEYLLSDKVPFSVYANYSYDQFAYHTHENIFTVGIKFYTSEIGATSLAGHQRMGDPPPHQLGF